MMIYSNEVNRAVGLCGCFWLHRTLFSIPNPSLWTASVLRGESAGSKQILPLLVFEGVDLLLLVPLLGVISTPELMLDQSTARLRLPSLLWSPDAIDALSTPRGTVTWHIQLSTAAREPAAAAVTTTASHSIVVPSLSTTSQPWLPSCQTRCT